MLIDSILFCNVGAKIKNTMAPGPLLPLLETLFHCRNRPARNWPKEAFTLIGKTCYVHYIYNEISKKKKPGLSNKYPFKCCIYFHFTVILSDPLIYPLSSVKRVINDTFLYFVVQVGKI